MNSETARRSIIQTLGTGAAARWNSPFVHGGVNGGRFAIDPCALFLECKRQTELLPQSAGKDGPTNKFDPDLCDLSR